MELSLTNLQATRPDPEVHHTGTPAADDRFELRTLLGKGGMASVYDAHDRKHGRDVALKVYVDDPRALRWARREAAAMRRLRAIRCPEILRIYGAGICTGNLGGYLVLELVRGLSCDALVRSAGALPVHVAAHIARHVARAVSWMEMFRMVHGDLKPANILLSSHGDVRLADFGLARRYGKAPSDFALGTPLYMSPETCSQAAVDGRSDVYSLGCVLHELLTGSAAFQRTSAIQVMLAHVNEDLPALHDFAGVPKGLADIVKRATERDPAQRYQSVDHMEEALAPFAGNRGDLMRCMYSHASIKSGAA